MILDRCPFYTTLADKYAVRDLIIDRIGEQHIVPLVGVYQKFEDIQFDALPHQFVLKCTHDSGSAQICTNKDNFDIDKLENKIKESKNIEELHTSCKLIAKHGLKQITTLFLALKNFYEYLESRNDTLLSVDTDYLEDYINRYCINLNISFGYRSNYKINIVAFLNYIDKECKLEHKFNIDKFKIINKKITPESIDWLDFKTFSRVNKEILKYPYKKNEELERNRDILIFRLFCFSGILMQEMAKLTIDSFIFKDNMMFLKIESDTEARNRQIPLPKEKLIRYFNKYIELKEPNTKTFFYGKNKQKIETSFLSELVKKYLDFCKVDVRDKTPKLLR